MGKVLVGFAEHVRLPNYVLPRVGVYSLAYPFDATNTDSMSYFCRSNKRNKLIERTWPRL